ncbi:hypothetical protein CIPAW_07G233500 [Carya illinoinensis]|uniref:Uncharacterized protein n=1 Tax=Carya illinoinensis TaxID=32201 RepID=A0A8T1Q6Q3_CARIL|nr:hypothetical protein CIPAW_07G233500 [Carya illinoinensis]
MESFRQFKVESKTFVFSKVGFDCFRILEKNRRMALYLLINKAAASWVVKMVEEATVTKWRQNFFRKMRAGNGVLTLHLLSNTRGCYLHLEEFSNGSRRGSLIIPEGVNSCGWEGFAYNLKKVAERATVPSADTYRVGVSGFRPSVSYAAALSGAAAECSSAVKLTDDKPYSYPADLEESSDRGIKLGEIEGVFWDIKAKLSGVLQEVAFLMNKVDIGLSMAMGRGKGIASATLPLAAADFTNIGVKVSVNTEKREPRPNGPLAEHGLNGPPSLIRVKSPQLQPTFPILSDNPQRALPRASSPQPRASSPRPLALPQSGSPTRVGQATRQPANLACGSLSSRPQAYPAGTSSCLQPSRSPTTLPASQTSPFGSGDPSGTDEARSKGTTAAVSPQAVPLGEENDVTIVPLASENLMPAQTTPTGPSEPLGCHLLSRFEAHSFPAICAAPSLLETSEHFSRVLCTVEEEVEEESGSDIEVEEEAFSGTDLLVPFSDMENEGKDKGNQGEDFSPICTLPPALPWSDPQTDWVLKKVEDIRHCAGISCIGFEDQLTALFTAIAAEQSHTLRSASKKERELKRLSCTLNYGREGSTSRERLTDRVNLGDP